MAQIAIFTIMALVGVAMSAPQQCICPMVFSPVCASNGQIFSNKCLMNCHNKETNENLVTVAADQCTQHIPPALQMYRVVVNHVEGCPCSSEYKPVCGSDIATYYNQCVFDCAAKKDPTLKMIYPRRCHFLA